MKAIGWRFVLGLALGAFLVGCGGGGGGGTDSGPQPLPVTNAAPNANAGSIQYALVGPP
jgi:hypothetical protein